MSGIPDDYGDDRLVALVRDPCTIFVYWELRGGGRQRLERELGPGGLDGGRWVLRLVNLDTGAISDVALGLGACNWYSTVEPGCAYAVALGFVDHGGAFHRLLACATVRMPPVTYSHVYDKQWMILEEDFRRLLAQGWYGFSGSSATGRGARSGAPDSSWLATVHASEPTEAAPTSPGAPTYTGRG